MGRKPCCNKEEVRRGAWTIEEDRLLEEYVGINGEGKWRSMPSKAGLRRCGKSCRLRWFNYLKPGIKRGNISVEEEDLIIELHNKFGNRWSVIAEGLPGRTDNEIKNYWNTSLKRKILKDGSKLEIRSKTRRPSTKKLAAMAEASDVISQSCEEYQPHADSCEEYQPHADSCSESATVSDDQKTSSSSSSASSFWKGLLQDLELEPVDPNPNPNPDQNNLDLVSGETSSGSNSKDSSDFDWNMDEIGDNSVGISPLSGGFADEHDLFEWLEYLDVGSISSFLDSESEDTMGEDTVT